MPLDFDGKRLKMCLPSAPNWAQSHCRHRGRFGAGSGNIESPGVQDLYTFTVTAGQSIYSDEQAGNIWWALLDSAGNEIFDRTNSDEGPVTLEAVNICLKLIRQVKS